MTIETNLLPRLLQMQKSLFSSLRLKDVIDQAVLQFSEVALSAKVALFLSDNDSLSLKLMSTQGYSEPTAEQLRILPFTAETLLKTVVQKRMPTWAKQSSAAPDISASVMERENSKGQIGLPLMASNLLIGAVLIDVQDVEALKLAPVLKDMADLVALAVGNAILFGRSEYERERLDTLYKTSIALSGSSMKVAEVLQITADTALILGSTPHCAVLMFDANKQGFNMAAFKGLDGASLSDFDLSIEGTVAGRTIMSGKTEYVSDSLRYQHSLPRSTSNNAFGSLVAVPMVFEHEPVGVLMLFSTDLRGFHREQIDLIESLANQASNALHMAFTHESANSQSIQDAHTGLYNRWHFEEAIQKEIERSQRHKHAMSLLILDIDHLSRVNEMLGQDRGDFVIKHVAKLIKTGLRDIDIPCRYGAEEFAIILPETTVERAAEVAERLRLKIRGEMATGVGMVTVSSGIAAFSANGSDATALLKAAEEALDIAKFEGRDRIKVSDVDPSSTEQSIAWQELAKHAKLAVVSERQSRLQSRLAPQPEYAPWMRATPGWGRKKTE